MKFMRKFTALAGLTAGAMLQVVITCDPAYEVIVDPGYGYPVDECCYDGGGWYVDWGWGWGDDWDDDDWDDCCD